jgi:hypothetical protein
VHEVFGKMKGGVGRGGWVGCGGWGGWGGYGSRCVNDGAGQRAGLSPGSTRNYGLFTINISSVVRSGHTLYADSPLNKLHLACGKTLRGLLLLRINRLLLCGQSIFRVSVDPEALFKEKRGVWNLYARAGFDLTLSHTVVES